MRSQYPQLFSDEGILFMLVLFSLRTKCSKGERICNASSREGVLYV